MDSGNAFSRAGLLFCFKLRTDRLKIVLWIAGITFFTLMVPVAFSDLYATQQERDIMAQTMRNPAMTAMVGHGQLDRYTFGAMTAHQMLLLTAVAVAIMNILLMVRHTRGEEEEGRIEVIRSLPVGRLANLNASCLVLFSVNLALALITGFGLYVLGIDSMNFQGSLLYGFVLGGAGLIFAGIAAFFAQLFESARSATGLSISFLIFSYLVRAFGDVGNETISWFSPLGWVTGAQVYSGNKWWPLLISVGASLMLFAAANYLNAVRDLEAGFFTAKPGRKNGSVFLQGTLGLAWRIQRTGTIAWAIGMLVLGLSYGSVLGDLEAFFTGNEMLEQLLSVKEGYSLTEQFIPKLMVVMALLATVSPLISMNKLYREEKKQRADHILGRAVSRTRLMGSYLFLSAVNAFVMISFAALGLWAAGTAVMDDGISLTSIYGAAIAYYPAMLVMISIAVLLIGLVPKISSFIWLYVLYSFVALYLGGLFQFPNWVSKLSPYGYIPNLPIEDASMTALSLLLVAALVITALGFIAYNKRDIY